MKLSHKYLFLALLVSFSCGKPSDQAGNEEPEEVGTENPNQALYEQVMDLHDEVMPRMEDIYKIKSELQEKIANAPDMVVEKREQLEKLIRELDAANNLMMDWMHQFKPMPDSADEEQSRAYLESQMEKIKNVREEMLLTIEQAKEEPNN